MMIVILCTTKHRTTSLIGVYYTKFLALICFERISNVSSPTMKILKCYGLLRDGHSGIGNWMVSKCLFIIYISIF